jgi:hypothetical protein
VPHAGRRHKISEGAFAPEPQERVAGHTEIGPTGATADYSRKIRNART